MAKPMMFSDYAEATKSYFINNNLDYDKLINSPRGRGEKTIFFMHYEKNPETAHLGLLDETPMPHIFRIHKGDDGEPIFEQTEFTKKYLSAECDL
ncbi:MAG: hypothetical protein LBL87_00530 [Ruminococcus sp.]|jgi:hypothetical protein|nr:hypothetical protein [Ruminococcus sp.]